MKDHEGGTMNTKTTSLAEAIKAKQEIINRFPEGSLIVRRAQAELGRILATAERERTESEFGK